MTEIEDDEETSELVEAARILYGMEMRLREENGMEVKIDALREARKTLEESIKQ